MSLFDGVDVVFYQVCSMDKAVDFYNGILGLEVLRREGNDWTELRAGETVIALSGELATRPHQGGATVILRTADIGAVEAALAANGVQRGRVEDMGGAQMLDLPRPRRQRDHRACSPRSRTPPSADPRPPAALALLGDGGDEAVDVLDAEGDAAGVPAERRAHPHRLGQVEHDERAPTPRRRPPGPGRCGRRRRPTRASSSFPPRRRARSGCRRGRAAPSAPTTRPSPTST